MERLTIRNFDDLSDNSIIMIIQFMNRKSLIKLGHYSMGISIENNMIKVYYRKTKKGIAIDIHKIDLTKS